MNPRPLTVVRGPGVPLMRSNIDTDVIIRIERMTGVPKGELGQYAFEAIRFRADGTLDPDCPLNLERFHEAPVLIGGPNFGCGSSREAAVWALVGMGVRCVIAASFGDIFRANCFQNGVLAIELPHLQATELAAQCAEGAPLTVDLVERAIDLPDGSRICFHIDGARRDALLNGLDDLGLTLRETDAITAWQQADRSLRPWVWLKPGRRAIPIRVA